MFNVIHRDIVSDRNLDPYISGCTVALVVLSFDVIIFANLGDSRILLLESAWNGTDRKYSQITRYVCAPCSPSLSRPEPMHHWQRSQLQ